MAILFCLPCVYDLVTVSWYIYHSFTVPLHNPIGRQMPAIRVVQRDCHWGLKNGGNSHWSREPILQWGTRQSQHLFRPANHKSVMPANWRPCLLPHWHSYCHHQAGTVWQSIHICITSLGQSGIECNNDLCPEITGQYYAVTRPHTIDMDMLAYCHALTYKGRD